MTVRVLVRRTVQVRQYEPFTVEVETTEDLGPVEGVQAKLALQDHVQRLTTFLEEQVDARVQPRAMTDAETGGDGSVPEGAQW